MFSAVRVGDGANYYQGVVVITRNRLTPEQRKEQIQAAALLAANKYGLQQLQRKQVASAANCAEGLVSYYFNTTDDLRYAAVELALRVPCYAVIAQAVTTPGDWPTIPDELRRRALEWVRNYEK